MTLEARASAAAMSATGRESESLIVVAALQNATRRM
jgi:hypothetical protein